MSYLKNIIICTEKCCHIQAGILNYIANKHLIRPTWYMYISLRPGDTDLIRHGTRHYLYSSAMDCLLAKCHILITDCVMAELEKLGTKYRVALRIAKDPRFERVPCHHKGQSIIIIGRFAYLILSLHMFCSNVADFY